MPVTNLGVGGEGRVRDDALGEGGVLLEAEASLEQRVADEPDGEVLVLPARSSPRVCRSWIHAQGGLRSWE